MRGAADSRRPFAGFTFGVLTTTLIVQDEVRELHACGLRLLEIFLSRPVQIFSKPHLIDRLFSFDEAVRDSTIEIHMGWSRWKLEGSGARLETLKDMATV